MVESTAKQELVAGSETPDRQKSSVGAVITGFLIVVGIGFGVWWTLLRVAPAESVGQQKSDSVKAILPMESFTVNLADQEEGRFLRTTLSLGIDGELPSTPKGEGKSVEADSVAVTIIRDSILTVLAQRRSGELLTPEGKLKLKADLIAALNRDVPTLGVREIYFTEFLVRR